MKALYSPSDFTVVRDRIFSTAIENIEKLFPIEDDNYVLRIKNLRYAQPPDITPEDERNAILNNISLVRPLAADIELYDKKEKRVISKMNKRLAGVPYLTSRGTFILNGVEYGFTNQQRLRPGIYTRLTPTGEYEALVNSAVGNSHRYVLNPEQGVFYINIGQARIPLFPLLTAAGVKEKDIIETWGNDIYQANSKYSASAVLQRLQQALEDKEVDINKFFGSVVLDPELNKITIDAPIKTLDAKSVLQVTKRLLDASRGKIPTSDRNHLAFLRLRGPEDLVGEAIAKFGYSLRNYFNRTRAKRDVSYFPAWVFDEALKTVFYGSGLSNPLQEINVLEILDNRNRVTRMGMGGIPSSESVAAELRYLHPSHANFIDPVLTPEGENVGVDNRLISSILRDTEGNIYSKFKDVKTGRFMYLTPAALINKVIAFPGELQSGRKYVRVIFNNQHVLVRPSMVDYEIPSGEQMFSLLSNLVPMKHSSYPQRISMGARMISQAVPLVERESPIVRNISEDGVVFDELYGKALLKRAPVSGTVTRVDKHSITIKPDKGEPVKVYYYSKFPFNRKTLYDEEPTVKAGDKVIAGQIITKSNHTDDKGNLALGRNLKTAYLAWEGYNFEDAAVISESAARKFTSQHLYQNWLDLDADTVLNKNKFVSVFPSKFKDVKELEKYLDNGIVRPGTILRKGDSIVLAFTSVPVVSDKGGRRTYRDISLTWEYEDPGTVLAAVVGPKWVNVLVTSEHPLRVGDKIAGRFADKHIVSAIVPDSQMPKDANGEPFELLLNPLGIVGRANVSQLWELLLGKVAKARKQEHIDIPSFKKDLVGFISNLLTEANLSDKEDVFIEKYNTKVSASTGYKYMMKLHHMAETKLSGRGTGEYTAEETPTRGGESGAKRVGLLEMLALLSHGAYHVARDARIIRGQKNEDYWTRLTLGYDAPKEIDTPMIYNKFLAELIGSGVYPKATDSKVNVFALTNRDIKNLVGDRFISTGEAISLKGDELKIIPGGLFDPKLTGGFNGSFWSGIKLPEKLPNPIVEPVIRSLLGLTEKDFIRVLAGVAEYEKYGAGSNALISALKSLNINKEIAKEEENIKYYTGNNLDAAVTRLKYLRALKEHDVKPEELFWEAVPVLPPIYRPVGLLAGNVPTAADVNYLYKDLFEVIDNYNKLKERGIEDPNDILLVYTAMKAVVGLGDPIHPKHKAQRIRGLISTIIGPSPKEGVVQRKLLGATVDLVGRATIIPNPNLSMDEVAIPENSAWEIYKPYIVRELIRKGKPRSVALEDVLNRTEEARDAMLKIMKERPVIISRAPVLHKYGVLAVWPKLTKNNTMEIHPFIVGGLGADFDGDTMQFHVPADDKAVKEAIEKLLPSKNLISFREFKAHELPTMEYLAGLYWLSERKAKGEPIIFRTFEDVLRALKEGKLTPDQKVMIV